MKSNSDDNKSIVLVIELGADLVTVSGVLSDTDSDATALGAAVLEDPGGKGVRVPFHIEELKGADLASCLFVDLVASLVLDAEEEAGLDSTGLVVI